MFSRKIFGIMIILLLAAGIAITTTRCYDDKNEARVTIHLERNDLAAMGIHPEKHFIDKVLEFFSTRAEAMSPNDEWESTNRTASCIVTLTITSPSFEDKTYSIPYNATEYTVIIPSSNNTTLKVISSITGNKNWGGHQIIDLGPGDQDVIIKMIPIPKIGQYMATVLSVELGINYFSSPPTNANSINIYRLNSLNGIYVKIATAPIPTMDSYYYSDILNLIHGTTYYYKISASGSDLEGVLSDVFTAVYP